MKRYFSVKTTNFKAYPFLKELGLRKLNFGVYRGGEWVEGKGGSIICTNPHNNEAIAKVSFGDKSDLNDCITAMQTN